MNRSRHARRIGWLLPALFVVVSLIIVAGAFLLYRQQLRDIRASREAELAAIGQLKASQIIAWRNELMAGTRSIALEPFFAAAVARWLAHSGDGALQRRLVERLTLEQQAHRHRNLLLATTDGRLLLSLDERLIELDGPTRELVLRSVATVAPQIGDLFRRPGSGSVRLDTAAPIVDDERRLVAVLVIRSAPNENLYPLLQVWPTPSRSAETLLVRRDGDDVLFLNPLRHKDGPPLSLRRPIASADVVAAKAARGEVGVVRGLDYRGVDVLADVGPVPDSGWFLVAKVDAEEILAEAHYRGRVIAVVAIGAIAMAALVFAGLAWAQRQERYRSLYRIERERTAALEEYRATLRGIGDAVISTDADGRVRQMNPVSEALTGWRESEARGRPLQEVFRIIHELTRAEVESPVSRVLRDGRAVELANHTLLIARDGTERPIADSGAPIRDEAGQIVGVVLVFRDQSAERAARAALAASEQRFRATFEQSVLGLGHVAPDGRWRVVNQRLCDILGYSRDELLALRWQDVTDPADLDTNTAQIGRILAGEIPMYVTEKNYLRKDGSTVWVQATVASVRRADGAPDYLVVAIEDISARKRTEEQLQRLLRAVEQSSESIVITNARGEIEYVNQGFERVSGYRAAEALGRNPRILQSGRTPRETYASMWATLLRGEQWTGEFHNRRKDGTEFLESASISPIRQPDGTITHYIAVKADITDRRRAERELEAHRHNLEGLVAERTAQLEEARRLADAANQAKSAFVANMSHEIRTPMNGVLGMLEVLGRTRLTAQQAEMVRIAQESGRTLLALIDDILDFSKIEAGRLEIDETPVSVLEVVEGLADSLVPVALRANVDLSVFVAPEIPERVYADPLRLRQVLFNLLGNAIKFSGGRSDRRGRVALRVTVAADDPLRLAFAVIDNGIGMSVDTAARLFTPFTQGEGATTRQYGGTGLGLTICKRLADLMHGEIDVDSRPGEGATFTLTLPLEVPEEQPLRVLPDLSGLHCVVVESPLLDVDGICRYLEHAGARVHRTADVRDAAQLAPEPTAPLVLVRHAGSAQAARLPPGARLPNLRQLLITPGRRQRARVESQDTVSLDGAALRRHALLRAVAVAAGRASPEIVQEMSALAHDAPATPPSVAEARDRGELILVAEDDDVNQKVILHQLHLLGRAAEIAHNGAEALRMWREGRYALLLTDLHMPDMDGYALIETIRRDETQTSDDGAARRRPIVALTANAMRGADAQARSLGVDDYLTKPVQIDKLRQAIDRWLPEAARAGGALPQAAHRAAVAPAAVLDVNLLRQLVGDDEAAVHEFLGYFLESAHKLREELRAALADDDAARVAAIAHKLKSSARSVGAVALANFCSSLERSGTAGRLADVRALGTRFERTLAEVDAQINAYIGTNKN